MLDESTCHALLIMLEALAYEYIRYGAVSPSSFRDSSISKTITLFRSCFSSSYLSAETAISSAILSINSVSASGFLFLQLPSSSILLAGYRRLCKCLTCLSCLLHLKSYQLLANQTAAQQSFC